MKNTILFLLFICSFIATIYSSPINSNFHPIKTFKILKTDNSVKNLTNTDTRPKYRIGFDAPQINHRQLLLTIDTNTTDGVDWGYEGEIPQVLADDMYWLIGDKKYVIQATNTLAIDKEFSLGIVTSNGGDITIKIDTLEYPTTDYKVCLKDNVLNIIHNLEESNYQIILAAGEYHNRFSIVFLSSTPEENIETTPPPPAGDKTDEGGNTNNNNQNNPLNKQKLIIYVNNGQNVLTIKNKGLLKLQKVTLFNRFGQQVNVWTKNLDSEIISLPVQVETGFYIVVVQTQKEPIFKKVIIQSL
jgi:hypothetical protein